MKAGWDFIGIFQKFRIKNLMEGSMRSDLKKNTRLLHIRNFGKPPHSQQSAQRACEG